MMKVRNTLLVIPLMTFFVNIAILLDIPILREIIAFVFLSFVPGFAILKLLKLREISFLETILFSVGLSIAFTMFIGLLVNELYPWLSQPLSTVPLTAAISAFTLTIFFVECRCDFSETLKLKRASLEGKLKNAFPLFIILFLLPFLSVLGALYLNVYVILFSCVIVAALCVISVVFNKLVPQNLFPFLIFSISIAIVCLVPLISKYVMGWDINLEYYVFRTTQISGHWAPLNANVNSYTAVTYSSMLSITLLPAVYSSLMGIQGAVFKILYPFIFSLVPLVLYRICENQFGKLTALLSALFFTFTSVAFLGAEPLSLSRQIVGGLFLILSVFLLINKSIPVTKRRLLLIIFGAALALSHYSLAYLYLAIVALVFIISQVKPRIDDTLNSVTVSVLFVITFSWYTLTNLAPLMSLSLSIRSIFLRLIMGIVPTTNTAATMYAVPEVFSFSTWINLLLTGMSYLFLIIGALLIAFRPKGTGIFEQYRVISLAAEVFLVISILVPSFAITLNFTRMFGISLLFLAPCFVLGGRTLLTMMGRIWTRIKRPLKRQIASESKNMDVVFLLIAILLSSYFLSQVGFINRVTGGSTGNYYSTNFDRMVKSNNNEVKISLYNSYIPEQDAYSASWLLSHRSETAEVFADSESMNHVLVSYGLVPSILLLPLTNATIPTQSSFIYMGSLNIVNGVISTENGFFNASEMSSLLNQNNIIYSNGNSEIFFVSLPTDSS